MAEQDKRTEGLPKLSGLDLKVGGEWAKALYDRAIPNFLKGYAKKWGAKVGTTDLSNGKTFSVEYDPKRENEKWTVFEQGKDGRQLRGTWKSEDAANRFKKDLENSSKTRVHSIEITRPMRDSVLKHGQPTARTQPTQPPTWADAVNQLATA